MKLIKPIHLFKNCPCINDFFRKSRYLKGTNVLDWVNSPFKVKERVFKSFMFRLARGLLCLSNWEAKIIKKYKEKHGEQLNIQKIVFKLGGKIIEVSELKGIKNKHFSKMSKKIVFKLDYKGYQEAPNIITKKELKQIELKTEPIRAPKRKRREPINPVDTKLFVIPVHGNTDIQRKITAKEWAKYDREQYKKWLKGQLRFFTQLQKKPADTKFFKFEHVESEFKNNVLKQ